MPARQGRLAKKYSATPDYHSKLPALPQAGAFFDFTDLDSELSEPDTDFMDRQVNHALQQTLSRPEKG